MTLRLGLIGCGNMARTYLAHAPAFRHIRFVACADLRPEAAQATAQSFGLRPCSMAELLASDEVDAVLNLTVPNAHAEVALAALEHGKHVYLEKPLATTLQDARLIMQRAAERQLRVGCAPDTVLGAGTQTARRLVDGGSIGRPISGCAAVLTHGMEHFHPNPDFFYQPGGGPILDRGPYDIAALVTILGPVASVMAVGQIGHATRSITAASSPRRGQQIKVEVFTTVQGLLSFACGAQISFLSSWDAWRTDLPTMEIQGMDGALGVPDPNWFGGDVRLSRSGAPWEVIATDHCPAGRPNVTRQNGLRAANYRGIGIADMALAIADQRPHRASGTFALHVMAVMEALQTAAREQRRIDVTDACARPEPLTDAEAAQLFAAPGTSD